MNAIPDAVPGGAGSAAPTSAASDTSWMSAIPDATPSEPAKPGPRLNQMSGWSPNLGAGLKEGVIGVASGVAGAPSDMIVANPINSVIDTVNRATGRSFPRVPSATETIAHTLDRISSPASDVVPGSAEQAVGRAGMRGVGGMAAGGLMGAAAGLPAVAAGLSPTGLASGAAGGATGEVAREVVPDNWKRAAELGGNLVGGGLVAGPVAATKSAFDRVAPAVQNFTAPFTAAGQTRLAAQRVAGAASDLPAAREALANPAEPLVPGSNPTTFQATGDPGLGTLERGVANDQRYAQEFSGRRGAQNNARVAAINAQAPPADPAHVGDWFRQTLADLNSRGEEEVGNARAATQGAVDRAGAITTPQEAGATVRQGVADTAAPALAQSDRAIAGAQSGAERAMDSLGGDGGTVQGYGASMRGAAPVGDVPGTGLEGARAPVKDAAGRLFDQVDRDGTLALDVSGVGDAARKIASQVNARMGDQIAPVETPVLDAAKGLRGVELFSDLRSLRSNIGTALRSIAKDQGLGRESQPYRRMSMLMDSVDRAMGDAVGSQAQRDAASVSAGTMRPEESITARLQARMQSGAEPGTGPAGGGGLGGTPSRGSDPAIAGSGAAIPGRRGPSNAPGDSGLASGAAARGRQSESLTDFLIQRGGIQDQGGELRANDLQAVHHRAGGRLVNPKGMPLDYAREAAAEAGFIRPNADINEFLDAVTSHQPVYRISEAADLALRGQQDIQSSREAHDRFMAATNVDGAIDSLGVHLSPAEHDHATQLAMFGAHPEDAVRHAARAGEEELLQRNAERNAFGAPGVPAGAMQAEMPVGKSQLKANFTAADRDALRSANAAYADYKARFRQGAAGDVLASDSRSANGYRLPDSAVPGKLFAGGPAGAEAADSLIKAAGSREGALKVLGDYPAFSLRAKAEEMGTLSVPKYEAWLKAHAAVMDKFPELRAQFDTAAKARGVLDELRSQRAALDQAYPIKPGWGDAEIMQRFVVPGPKGREAAQALLDATKASPASRVATRDYLASSLRDAAEVRSGPNAGTIDPGAYGRWMKQYDSFLSHPEMADVRTRFQDVGAAQQTLDRATAEHVAARKAFDTSVARHFLGQDVDPVTAIGGILESKSAAPQMADLARLTASDPMARQAIQKTAIEYMLRKLRSNNVVGTDLEQTYLRSDALQNFIRAHVSEDGAGALRRIMDPEQLDALNKVALDLRRSNLSNQNPAGSPTTLNTSALHANDHRPSTAGMLAAMETGGELAHHVGGPLAKVAGVLIAPILNKMRQNGFAHVDDLVAEAALHPSKMKALFDVMPQERQIPSRMSALMGQIGALAASSQEGKSR